MNQRFFVREIGTQAELYRDEDTGIAWVVDGNTGKVHSCHSFIDKSASAFFLKKLPYWKAADTVLEVDGARFNISRFSINEDDALDLVAAAECNCESCRLRRSQEVAESAHAGGLTEGVSDPKQEERAEMRHSGALARCGRNGSANDWFWDVLDCVDSIPQDTFTLDDVYSYQNALTAKHPKNKHVQAKIRRQLQLLRDEGVITFLGKGKYRKNRRF